MNLDTSTIIGVIGTIFNDFKGIILLIFGVFFGGWIFELIVKGFMDLAEDRAWLDKREIGEINQLVRLGKGYGFKFNKKLIMKKEKEERKRKTFEKLAKKYNVEI